MRSTNGPTLLTIIILKFKSKLMSITIIVNIDLDIYISNAAKNGGGLNPPPFTSEISITNDKLANFISD